jgi:hypothetical protein
MPRAARRQAPGAASVRGARCRARPAVEKLYPASTRRLMHA